MEPIETAPKDKRILLIYEKPFFTAPESNMVCGNWDDDCWTNDYEQLLGKRQIRLSQPIGWFPLPFDQ